LEANNLAQSLQQHELNVAQIQRKDAIKNLHDQERRDIDNIQLGLNNGNKLTAEQSAKAQERIEGQVQQLLEQLTILTND